MRRYSLPLFSLACWTLTGFSSVQALSIPSNSSSSCVQASQWTEVNANPSYFNCIESAEGVNYSFDCVSGGQSISISNAANNPWQLPGLTWQGLTGTLNGAQCAQTYEKFLDLFGLTQAVVDNPRGAWARHAIYEQGSYYLSYAAQDSKTPLFWCSINPIPGPDNSGTFNLSLGLEKVQSMNTDNISTVTPLSPSFLSKAQWSKDIESNCDSVRAGLEKAWNAVMPPACMNPEYWVLDTSSAQNSNGLLNSGWANTTLSCSSWFGTPSSSCVMNQNLAVYTEGASSTSNPGSCGQYNPTPQTCASCYVQEKLEAQLNADPCFKTKHWSLVNDNIGSSAYSCTNQANTYSCYNLAIDNQQGLLLGITTQSDWDEQNSAQCGAYYLTPENCRNCYLDTQGIKLPNPNYQIPE